MESVATYPTIRLALRMILLTLVRKSELIEATWDEVDFENATWTIPKQRMKGRNPHVVYLSRQALDIFVALHTCAAGSKFVLPSRYDADRCMSKRPQPGHADRVRAGQGCRFAARTFHGARPAPHRLDAAQRGRLQRRLDREVPGA
jgi:integrase